MKIFKLFLAFFALFLIWKTFLFAFEIEQEEWEEIEEVGVHLHEELLVLTEERSELLGVIGELKEEVEEAEEEERHEIEMEISRLKIETKSQEQLIRLHEKQLADHKKVLQAKEGADEEVFWQTLETFHRFHDGFHLRTELVYLNQEKQLLSAELKFLKSIGENQAAQGVESDLHLAELNLVAHSKLLEKREALEAIWKEDPHADTEDQEVEFWILSEENDLQRLRNELKHTQKSFKQERKEIQKAQHRLEKKAKSIQDLESEVAKANALFDALLKSHESEDEEQIEELEERYYQHREALHLKREIYAMREHLMHLIDEGEEEEAEEVELEIRELQEELEELE